MRLEISGHQVELTAALNDYVKEKMDKLGRHFDHHLDVRVILTVNKLEHKAEATLSPAGKNLFANATAPDMYAAIDMLVDKLDRILMKEKEKMTDHHRGNSAARSDSFG